jgi:hypothetical protein
MKRASLALLTWLGAACRFGAGDGVDVGWEDEGDAPVVRDAGGIEDFGSAGLDGGRVGPSVLASRDAAATSPVPPLDASGAACHAPPALACDPVRNEGCLPFTQCIADPAQETPAAVCVLSGLRFDDGCAEDAFSTNCPAGATCVMNECRKYCYCDSDCDPGSECGERAGNGFKVCAGKL